MKRNTLRVNMFFLMCNQHFSLIELLLRLQTFKSVLNNSVSAAVRNSSTVIIISHDLDSTVTRSTHHMLNCI